MADAFLAAARKAHQTLEGTAADASGFARSLEERFDASKLEALNLPDLFLAWAALAHDPAALRELDRRLKACAHRLNSDSLDDVLQVARQRLLVGDGKKPKLRAYGGQGALVKWLRTVLLSISIDTSRKEKPDQHTSDEQLLAKASSEVGADVSLMKAHHKAEFTKAFTAALQALTPQERTVLRMRFVDQLPIEDVGKTFGVHRTTAMRWMEAAFEKVLADTRTRLGERLKLEGHELDSLWRAFQPSLADRLSRLLPAMPKR
jgi:RNA polymerase sigma-70 factor (ECF subfamily)